MADQPKKPRNIKDLKAKLGQKGGAAPAAQPAGGGVAPPPGAGPQPVASSGLAAPPGAVVAPAVVAPVVAPIAGPIGGGVPAPSFLGGGAAAPSFLQDSKPPPAGPSMADPFAAQVAQGPREVRLVIDEKPVDDSEVGRKQQGRIFAILGLGLLFGLLVGAGGASLNNERLTYNAAVRSGKHVYEAVTGAATKVEQAKTLLERVAIAANGAPGKAPTIDYASIEALVALETPFHADQFSRENYKLFNAATVDDLFKYYNNVQQIWTKITSLAARTAAPRRPELDESARAASEVVTLPVGCVPAVGEGRMTCNLVFVQLPDANAPPPEDGVTKVRVGVRPNAFAAEKILYTSQDLTEDPTQYLIGVNPVESVGVLGQRASLFGELKSNVNALGQLVQETMEIQGRLQTSLGEIAALQPQFALGDVKEEE